jgi:hypothetical protein
LKKLLVKYQREENEAILRPLARAHGFEESGEHGVMIIENSVFDTRISKSRLSLKIPACPRLAWMFY